MEIDNVHDAMRFGYIARPEQLIENEEVSIRQGNGRTITCQKISLPNQVSATVVWDRCMDITRLNYRGIPFAYLGKGEERNDLAMPFPSRFSGGMLYTCGLQNVGPGDEIQPTHGRIHLQSAGMRSIRNNGEALVLEGEMREAALFGENLLLNRKLEFNLGQAEITIRDTITNQTLYEQEWMLLYHINLGYPFLDEHLKLQLPPGTQTQPATEDARLHMDKLTRFAAPEPGFIEQDYRHQLPAEDGYCRLHAENEALHIGMGIRYKADTLPYLQQWRCLRSGDYVLGLEPTNNHVNGRLQAKAENSLPVLRPFETITTEVVLSFYSF